MDFSALYQTRNKKSWWVDVVLYFGISLLMATAVCYLIFAVKISLQNIKINGLEESMKTIGTDQQKEYEKQIFAYQKKINDFSKLFNSHKLPLNVFRSIEQNILANVWFSKFYLSEKQSLVSLTGETENMQVLSHQISILEKNQYIKKINILDSNIGENGKVNFSISLSLDPEIFSLAARLKSVQP